jgi:hypothetical protein
MLDPIGHTPAIEALGQQNTTEYNRYNRVGPGQSRLDIEAVGSWDHQATGRRWTTNGRDLDLPMLHAPALLVRVDSTC